MGAMCQQASETKSSVTWGLCLQAVRTDSDADAGKGAVPTSMDILALRTQGPGSDQAAALPIMRAPGEHRIAIKKSPCCLGMWLHACLLAYSVSSHQNVCPQPNPSAVSW